MRGGIWLIAAQGFSSLGNLALAVMIARGSSAEVFALFALSLPAYLVAQRVVRVYLLIPRQVAFSRSEDVNHSERHPGAAVLLLSVSIGLVIAIVGALWGNPWIAVLGLAMPGLLSYDCLRNEVLIRRKMRRVAVLDFVWLAGQLAGGLAVVGLDLSPVWLMIAWCVPPVLIAATGAWFWKHNPWPTRGGVRDLWESRSRVADGVTDIISSVLVVQMVPYLVWAIAGLGVAGGLRGGQILLGPVNVAVMGLLPQLQMAAAEVANKRRDVMCQLKRHTAILSTICAVYGFVLLAVPDRLGFELLGPTWVVTEKMLLGLAILGVARVPFLTVITGMRSVGFQRLLIRQRIIGTILLLAGAVFGAALQAPAVLPAGMAAGAGVSAAWAYIAFIRQPWPRKR